MPDPTIEILDQPCANAVHSQGGLIQPALRIGREKVVPDAAGKHYTKYPEKNLRPKWREPKTTRIKMMMKVKMKMKMRMSMKKMYGWQG